MNRIKLKTLIVAFFLATTAVSAQAGLKFSLNDKGFDVVSDGMEYALGDNQITFDISGPAFCFDFESDLRDAILEILVGDIDGAPVMDGLPLDSVLTYDLTQSRLEIVTSPGVECFYPDQDGELGLFGEAPTSNGGIFKDRFTVDQKISLSYDGPIGVVDGQSFSYTIGITNNGNHDITVAGFQELYPVTPDAALFALPEEEYICEASGGASCGFAWDGTPEFIRHEGIVLPVGGELEFVANREVVGNVGGEVILHWGVVSGDGVSASPAFAAKTISIPIEGEATEVRFEEEPGDEEIFSGQPMNPVIVALYDDNGNRVTHDNESTIDLELRDVSSASGTLIEEGKVVENGEAEFDGIVIEDPGTYKLRAFLNGTQDVVDSEEFEVLSH